MMDEQRISERLDKITDIITDQHATLVRLTVTVEEHVRRSNMLEDAQQKITSRIDSHDMIIERGKGIFWLLGLLGALVTLASKIWK